VHAVLMKLTKDINRRRLARPRGFALVAGGRCRVSCFLVQRCYDAAPVTGRLAPDVLSGTRCHLSAVLLELP